MIKVSQYLFLIVIASCATAALASNPGKSCDGVKPGANLYDVYFGRDEVILTLEAQMLVDDAAGLIARCGIDRVRLVGHGDAGEVSSKPKIGRTRAEAVKGRLISNGVAASKISIHDAGSSKPEAISLFNQKVTVLYLSN